MSTATTHSLKTRSRSEKTEGDRIKQAVERGEKLDLKLHPAALIFPPMPNEQLEKLAADIAERGQQQPILLHPDGTILDGRNRWEACKIANREPLLKVHRGAAGTEIELVISQNLHRRQMTDTERCMSAARTTTVKRGRPRKGANLPNINQEAAAKLFNVSPRNVRVAVKVIAEAPENIVRLVEQNSLSLHAAAAIVNLETKERAVYAELGDEEVLKRAKGRSSNSASASKHPTAEALVKRVHHLAAAWDASSSDTREKLRALLDKPANADDAKRLQDLMTFCLHSQEPANAGT